jgi:hypothetical protein
MSTTNDEHRDSAQQFADEADQKSTGLLREMWDFMRFNKKWWLTPVILVLLLLGVFILLSSTAAAPFIYTLF